MQGGKRKGAGRKEGFSAKNAEEARRTLSEMVMREIIPIGEALITKAKNGDISAIKELFDRAWGKAHNSVDITTQGEKIGTEFPDGADASYMDELVRRVESELKKELTGSY